MSRAFVKDLEDAVEELPDRPISPHPNLVTAEGLARIEAEVARLQQEHAAAHAANDRAALARAARDLRYWTARRASAQLVPEPSETAAAVRPSASSARTRPILRTGHSRTSRRWRARCSEKKSATR